jgi:hypothetical protein
MKQPLKSRRPTPAEALAVAAETAPSLPPAQMPPPADRPGALTMRLRTSTIAALTATARERGQTIKQVVAHALAQAGVSVMPADLEDRTPRRQ